MRNCPLRSRASSRTQLAMLLSVQLRRLSSQQPCAFTVWASSGAFGAVLLTTTPWSDSGFSCSYGTEVVVQASPRVAISYQLRDHGRLGDFRMHYQGTGWYDATVGSVPAAVACAAPSHVR